MKRKIKIIISTSILIAILILLIYFNIRQKSYNKIINNIDTIGPENNVGTSIMISNYDEVNGWSFGEIKDINISVDFADEISEGKKIEFILPDGMEYIQAPVSGEISGNENRTYVKKIETTDILSGMIEKTILPETEFIMDREYRDHGKITYEIDSSVKKIKLKILARIDASKFYKKMYLKNPIKINVIKGNQLVETSEKRVLANGEEKVSKMRFINRNITIQATKREYASIPSEKTEAYGETVGLNTRFADILKYGYSRIYVKNIRLIMNYPRGMNFEGIEFMYSSENNFKNYRVQNDPANSRAIITGDWGHEFYPVLRYSIPEGTNTGIYYAKEKDSITYEFYDGEQVTAQVEKLNQIEVVERNNFVNKMNVEPIYLIPGTNEDHLDLKRKDSNNDGQVYLSLGFALKNSTLGYKNNQISEWIIPQGLKPRFLEIPFDFDIQNNTVPTTIEIKTNINDQYRTVNAEFVKLKYSLGLETKKLNLASGEYITGLKVNSGKFSNKYSKYGDIIIDFNIKGSGIKGIFDVENNFDEGNLKFSLYDGSNKEQTYSEGIIKVKSVNNTDYLSKSSIELAPYSDGSNSLNVQEKIKIKAKTRVMGHSYLRRNRRYLHEPTFYIREPEGFKIEKDSIKLFFVKEKSKTKELLTENIVITEHQLGNGEKVFKIVTDNSNLDIGELFAFNSEDYISYETYGVDLEFDLRLINNVNKKINMKDYVFFEKSGYNPTEYWQNNPQKDIWDINQNGSTEDKLGDYVGAEVNSIENRNVNVSTEVVIDGKKHIYTAGDNTTIPKFTAQTAGIYDIKLNNWSTGPAQSLELYIPVPKTGMNFGPNFQKEEFKFDMNLTEIKNLPANYIVEYSKNATSADNYQTAVYEQNVDNLSDVTMIRIKNKNPIPENQEDRISIGMRINETYENAVANTKNGKINIFNPVIKVNSPTYEGTLKGTTAAAKLFIPKIKGIVFSDNNGDGISNGEIDRLNNITVELYKENTKIADTTTNVKGEFSFDENQIKDETNYEIRVTRPSQKFITWKNEESGNELVNSDAEKGEGNYDLIKNINPVAKSSGELGIGYISLKSEATLPELRIDKTIIKQGESIGINFGIPIENHKKAIKNLTDSGYRLEFNGGSENAGNVEVIEIGDTYTAPTLNPGEKERIIKIYKTATLDGTEEVGEPITIRVVTNVPPTITANEITSFVGDNEKDYKTIVSAQNVASENIVLTDDNFVVENLAPVADGKYTQAGTYKITYKVKDEYGNEAIKESKIKINEPARIITKDIVVVENNLNALDTNIRASWKRAGNEIGEAEELDLTNNVTKTVTGPTQDFSKSGEYTVRYSVEAGGRTVEKEIKVVVISANDVKNGNYTLVAKDIEIEQKEALTITKDQILEKAQAILYKEENNVINKIADGQTLNKEKFEIESAKIEEIKGTKPSGKEYTLRITANDGEMTISKEIKVKVKADDGKILAINELEEKANEKIAAIRLKTELTNDERTAAEAQINEILNSAKEKIEKADTEEKVNTAKNNGISAIDGVNPEGTARQRAINELEARAEEKNAEIRNRQDLTTEEKEEAVGRVNTSLNDAKQIVETSETNAQVEDAKIAGIGSINGINPIATVKPNAKNAVKEAADNKINEIRDNISLTNEEKLIEIEKINQKLEEINNNINAALGNTDVDNIKNAAINEINDIEVESTIKPEAITRLQTNAEEKIAEIRARQDLTSEEKEESIENVNQRLNEAKQLVENSQENRGVESARDSGIIRINEVNPVAEAKPNAVRELEERAEEKKNATNLRNDLTNEEKAEVVAQINQRLNEAKSNVNSSETNTSVENAKNTGISAINSINPSESKKAGAIVELEATANEKIAEIKERQDLTNEEKSAAETQIKEILNSAKEKIEKADTDEKVNNAKNTGISAIDGVNPEGTVKKNAIAELERKANEKIEEIDERQDLTNEEKQTGKSLVEIAKNNAKAEINESNTNAEVIDAKTRGIAAINEINPTANVKENARKLIDESLKSKKNTIEASNNLTNEEKNKITKEIEEIAKNGKMAISDLETNAEVLLKTEEIINQITNKELMGKTKSDAISELEAKANEKIAEIKEKQDLTKEEKEESIRTVQEKINSAKQEIENAKRNEEVEAAKINGLAEIESLNLIGKVKPEAIAELERKASENIAKVNTREDLVEEEKAELISKILNELEKAKEAINKAKTNEEVNKIKEKFLNEIANLDIEDKVKTKAIEELKKLLEEKKKEIDLRKDLTIEEKDELKAKLDKEYKKSVEAINKAKTNAEIQKILEDFKETLNQTDMVGIKTEILKELESLINKQKEEIDNRKDLTEEEKEVIKRLLDDKLNEAKRRLYEAETKEEVEKIKQELIDYIKNPKIDQNLIDNLVQKLEEEAKKAKEKIDARTDITEEEKAKLKKEIDEKLERQKNILNNFNKGKIIVKYIDIQSKEEIAENIEIQKVIGETYKVEPKTFKYHVLVETPEKEEGIVELGTKTLEYKYRRKIFNFEVNTELNNARIDGKELNLNNKKISKIELTRKQIENSKLVINYKLIVTNSGEIRGKGKLEINLPKGFKLVENSMFKIDGNKIRTEEFELGINENKEFNLELEWINGKDEFGTIDLAAEVVETQNEANYEETNSENETKDKKSTILLTVKTGETEIKTIGLLGLITLAISVVVIKRKK